MTILSAALLLFLILDPLGNIPVFLSVLKPLTPKRQRIVLARELLIALAVLMAFLWAGKYALEMMHLRQESVAIAGSSLLCSEACLSLTLEPGWHDLIGESVERRLKTLAYSFGLKPRLAKAS